MPCPPPCPLPPPPAATPDGAHTRGQPRGGGNPASPRPRSPGSQRRCGRPRDTGWRGGGWGWGGNGTRGVTLPRQGQAPEGQRGDRPGGASAARGARGRRGSRPVPAGGHGCRRAPLSPVISAAFPAAAAASREPLFPVTAFPAGELSPHGGFPPRQPLSGLFP